MCCIITRKFLSFPCSFESQQQAGTKHNCLQQTSVQGWMRGVTEKKTYAWVTCGVGGSENRCPQQSNNTQVVRDVPAEVAGTHRGSHGGSGTICICCPVWCLWISSGERTTTLKQVAVVLQTTYSCMKYTNWTEVCSRAVAFKFKHTLPLFLTPFTSKCFRKNKTLDWSNIPYWAAGEVLMWNIWAKWSRVSCKGAFKRGDHVRIMGKMVEEVPGWH